MPRTSFIGRVLLIFAILLVGCSKDKYFEVSGTIKGNPTMNIRYIYYNGQTLVNGVTAAREGKFAFRADSDQPVMVELYDNDYKLLGRLYAENGDKIKAEIDPANPYLSGFDGNDINKRYSQFTKKNAAKLAAHDLESNKLIAAYVGANPADVVSAMLVVGSYNASRDIRGADSLLLLVKPEARPENITSFYEFQLSRVAQTDAFDAVLPMTLRDRADSLVSYNPRRSSRSLLVFSDRNSGRSDSIVPRLRELSRQYGASRLAIVDFSVDADTLVWKSSTRTDSASWLQTWSAGSLAAPAISRLGIPAVPYYIVTDSLGNQLYRGVSLSGAVEKL